jgi:RNA polymerase sigma-70 factor (ECF subfamily)
MGIESLPALGEWTGMQDDSLYATHGPMVAGICWRILGHRADAEDAMQDTFLQACQLAARESIHNWPGLLRRLATTCALARLRKRRSTSPFVEELVSREESPIESLQRKELHARLRTAIANLPPREAEVFCLRYLENLSHEEIVLTLHLPYAAVTSAIYRARKRLETVFADVRIEEDRR